MLRRLWNRSRFVTTRRLPDLTNHTLKDKWKIASSLYIPRHTFEPHSLVRFDSKGSLHGWKLYSDAEFGGKSSVKLELMDNKAIFSGSISPILPTELVAQPEGRKKVKNTGFAAIMCPETQWNIDKRYDAIVIRAKSDGSVFLMSLKQNSMELQHLIYQASFKTSTEEMSTVMIPMDGFATPGGTGTDTIEVPEIVSLGFMIKLPHEGPFRLEIESIGAISLRTFEHQMRKARMIEDNLA
eukprot:TRINITY_DN6843_c0_g1_i2.p1 TRINITY_DN6843_c0_g1~~TRINITY_DN6843_c0_g1_i2.p1  ORF type:complete len:240 (-),score=44.72 TRINITY_DN6843_c0_g1_i2:177-896(-)